MNKLIITDPSKLYFTSDTHFSHKAILSHQDRPFLDLKDHDETLIKNWNDVVSDGDIVIHQGDFSLGLRSNKLKWILESLNGDIYLVKGNHEKDIMKKAWARSYFKDIQIRYEIEVNDKNGNFKTNDRIFNVIVADHFAMLSWNKSHFSSYHTFGHSHGKLKHPSKFAYDVGVDTNDFRPISYYELIEKFKNA